MSLLTYVREAIAEIATVGSHGDAVYVNTLCIYPSNGFVQVMVYGNQSSFTVSDNGGAVNELQAAGVDLTRSDASLSRFVKRHGLTFRHGEIQSPVCSRAELPSAIALVANASKDLADWLFDNSKIKRNRDIKAIVRSLLQMTFDRNAIKEDGTIVGVSNKPHKFENIIFLSNDRRLIVDPVIRDASSINARVVANMDVRLANLVGVEQRIIYDDEDDWQPEDLNLLQVGATVVPFSQSAGVIRRVAGL